MPKFVSFGYHHPEGAPKAHLTLDVRDLFDDPAGVSDEMRQMTGLDPEVVDNVLRQPGAEAYVHALVHLVLELNAITPDLVIAAGCKGGRHRSVAIVNAAAEILSVVLEVTVEHRDIAKDIVRR
jgi:RNase adapter protein RapZ